VSHITVSFTYINIIVDMTSQTNVYSFLRNNSLFIVGHVSFLSFAFFLCIFVKMIMLNLNT